MKLIVADVETTGFTLPSAIVELAWAEVDENLEFIKRVCSRIDPQIPIQPGASGVHGITNADVADEPTLEEFLTVVEPGAFDGGIVVVAHNAAHDMQYLGPIIPELTGVLCTLKCARKIYVEAPDHKLQTLRYWLNLDVSDAEAHSAAGDVEVTLALLKRLMQDSGLGLEGLLDISKAPMHIAKMPFGKHKGEKLADLPKPYVDWLLNKAEIDEDLRYTLTNLK